MRSYSFFTIFLLCVVILIVDVITFYWLMSITKLLISPILKYSIYTAFWIFSIGLISAILILRSRLNYINPYRKQLLISSLYGITVSSFIPKLFFIIVVSIFYFTNYVLTKEQSIFVIATVGLLSGVLPFIVIVYGIFRTLYRFKTRKFKLKLENLPKNFNKLRIVQISDLHLGSFSFRYHILDRAIHQINHLEPDLIFFTGDLVNNYAWELKGWTEVLQKLSAKIGKFSVLGNHDYGDYSEWKSSKSKKKNLESIKYFYKKIDFKLLLNEAEIIEKNNEKIAVVGVENWGKPPFKQYGDLNKALQNTNGTSFKILLSHDPSHWNEEVVNLTDIALTFSGHTHGMQVGIHLKNKQWSPIKYKYKHWAGLYETNNQYLHVNRGLGWLGFPGRLGMRPEITFMELQSSN